MAASNTDKITDTRNAARPNSARVTSGRSAAGATLACDNLAGWPTPSKVHFVTYTVDSSSNPVAGTQLDCYGIVSGNNIGSMVVVDGTDTGNSIGDYVEMLPTAAWGQDLADALTTEHNRTGTHKNITTDTITVSSGSTLPAGDIGTADLATNAVTTVKITNANVTADKLATGAANATVATSETTTSTSYTNLTTTTDTVTVTIGANGLALISLYCHFSNSGLGNYSLMAVDISGANTVAATDNTAAGGNVNASSDLWLGNTILLTGLTAGSTTFKAKYRVSAGTGTFSARRITVVPL